MATINNDGDESDSVNPDFVWNFDNIPLSVRAEGNIGNVMQSIVPEIERRMNTNIAEGPNSQNSSHFTPRHMNTPTQGASHFVQMGAPPGHGHSHAAAPGAPDENRNFEGTTPPSAQGGQANMLRSFWKMAQSWIPFALLLLTKLLYNHRLGKSKYTKCVRCS